MIKRSLLNVAVIVALGAALFGLNRAVVSAAPALNDNFASATPIGSLPFSDAVDVTEATNEPDEPQQCNFLSNTVWYAYTPAVTTQVRMSVPGSGFSGQIFNVYQAFGPNLWDLSFMNCGYWDNPVIFNAQAGQTYYIQAGLVPCGYPPCANTVEVSVEEVQPPANDDVANAVPVTALPFDHTVDLSGATREAGEPHPTCEPDPNSKTVWYTYTPESSGFVAVSTFGAPYATMFAVYTGAPLAGLTQVGCTSFGSPLAFQATAGTTYYIQIAALFGGMGSLQVRLEMAHDVAITKFQVPTSASAGQTRQITVGLRNHNQPDTVRVELWRSTPSGFVFVGSLEQFVPVRSGNRTTDFQFSYTFTASDAAMGKVVFMTNALILNSSDMFPADNQSIASPTKVGR